MEGTSEPDGENENRMGVVENIPTYPDCYDDTVMTLADLTCWVIDQVILKMKTKPGFGFG